MEIANIINKSMKIKSNKNSGSSFSEAKKKPLDSKMPSTCRLEKPKPKLMLPSELTLYNELVEQLGLKSKEDLQNFRKRFKEKYNEHLQILQHNFASQSRFREGQQKQQIHENTKIKEKRQQIATKQENAKHRKIEQKRKRNQKNELDHQKWMSVIEKNKHEYLTNIKNSMKLIKRWETKLTSSALKRSQHLENISHQMREHSEYVNFVAQRNRTQENLEAENKIMRFQEVRSRSGRSGISIKSARKKTEESEPNFLNPEKIFSPTGGQRAKTYVDNSPILINESAMKNHVSWDLEVIKERKKKIKLSKSKSHNQSNIKEEIDVYEIEECLAKNINKEKRIAEARNVKSYLHNQRNKQNRLKQQSTKLKILQNLKKINDDNQQKNRKLDEKFREERSRQNNNRIGSPNSRLNSQIEEPSNFSLPIIRRKHKLNPIFDPIEETSSRNKISVKFHHRPKISKLSFDDRDPTSFGLYITECKHKSERKQENDEKYNRKIMDKLRNMSIVASIRNRQEQEKMKEKSMERLKDGIINKYETKF